MEGKYKMLLVLVIVALITTKETFATQHVVGGSQGWDQSTDFSSWASGQTFKVGDQLVFKYSSGLHSLVEVGTETAFKNCNLGSALDSKKTGNDVVKLNKVGTRYFTCGTLGHCDQGMKLKITTVAADATPSSSSSSSPSSSSSSPSSTTSNSAASMASIVRIMVALFASLCMLIM